MNANTRLDPEQIATCRAWLRKNARIRKEFNTEKSSARIAAMIRTQTGQPASQSALIEAACRERYRLLEIDDDETAVYLNIQFICMFCHRDADDFGTICDECEARRVAIRKRILAEEKPEHTHLLRMHAREQRARWRQEEEDG